VIVGTLVGNLYLVVGTLVLSMAAIVAALLRPGGAWVGGVARLWARGVLAASLVRLEVERTEALPEGSAVFVANHQSLFDIPALLVALPGEVRFLAKAGLFQIPVFGWALRLGGFIPVDRGRSERTRRSFASALARLARGTSVVVFPEEQRSLDGRLLPFRRGGILLALRTGLPIVPVGLEGALAVQHRRSFAIRPGIVRVRIGRRFDLAGATVRDLAARGEELRREVARLAVAGLAGQDDGDGRT